MNFLIFEAHVMHDFPNDMGLNVLREILFYHGHNTIDGLYESVRLDEPLNILLYFLFLQPSLLLLIKEGLNHVPPL